MQVIYFLLSLGLEQHNLHSSINFAMYIIKPGTLTAEAVNNNMKRTIETIVASGNAFSFMSFMKGLPACTFYMIY